MGKQNKKYTFEYVKNFFEKENCELIDDKYVNNISLLNYRCSCGTVSKIGFSNFKKGVRCKKCGIIKRANKHRLTFECVQDFFKKEGCQLIDTRYQDSSLPLNYICKCGNISKISFNDFKSGHRCKKCSTKKLADKKRLTFEYVKNFFEKENCVLIDDKYFNNHFLLNYICECGAVSKISFNSFKNGGRCKKCGYQKVADKKKLSFQYVDNFFKKEGCILLDKEYKNNRTLLNYVCQCGTTSKISFGSFQSGNRCKKCGVKKATEKIRAPFEYVKNFFEKEKCILLDTEYKHDRILLNYICECGSKAKISFSHFKQGHRCRKCGTKKGADKRRSTIECVKKFFEDGGCILLETEYINEKIKMKYICVCGDINIISFNKFKQGHRCQKCSIKKRSGVNHHNYNPNLTDEEREKNKSRLSDPVYKAWRTKVYKRDSHTCQRCFKIGGVNGHHIKNWSSNKELRYVVSNGITLCENCHDEFHKAYGYRNNNQTQLDEFFKKPIDN